MRHPLQHDEVTRQLIRRESYPNLVSVSIYSHSSYSFYVRILHTLSKVIMLILLLTGMICNIHKKRMMLPLCENILWIL